MRQLTTQLESHLARGRSLQLIATPNPEQVVLAHDNREFQSTLKQFNWLLPDGTGLVLASRWLKLFGRVEVGLTERLAGVDLTSWLLRFATEHNLKVLIVGGRMLGDVEFKIGNLKLKIIEAKGPISSVNGWEVENKTVGQADNDTDNGIFWFEGYRDKRQPTKTEEQAVVTAIQNLRPDVVLVALGAPEQEQWLVDHRQLLAKVGVKLGLTIGGAMDMLTGRVLRAPGWLQTVGLEWFWRLLVEPWRWRRQLSLFRFVGLVARGVFR